MGLHLPVERLLPGIRSKPTAGQLARQESPPSKGSVVGEWEAQAAPVDAGRAEVSAKPAGPVLGALRGVA